MPDKFPNYRPESRPVGLLSRIAGFIKENRIAIGTSSALIAALGFLFFAHMKCKDDVEMTKEADAEAVRSEVSRVVSGEPEDYLPKPPMMPEEPSQLDGKDDEYSESNEIDLTSYLTYLKQLEEDGDREDDFVILLECAYDYYTLGILTDEEMAEILRKIEELDATDIEKAYTEFYNFIEKFHCSERRRLRDALTMEYISEDEYQMLFDQLHGTDSDEYHDNMKRLFYKIETLDNNLDKLAESVGQDGQFGFITQSELDAIINMSNGTPEELDKKISALNKLKEIFDYRYAMNRIKSTTEYFQQKGYISQTDQIGPNIGYITASEWGDFLNMPNGTLKEANEKKDVISDLFIIIQNRKESFENP